MDVSSWKWNPRYDLDLVQRCLFILFFTWFTNWLFQLTFLNYIFGNYLVHLGSTIALLMALAKSSIQFSPKEKSVLITGKNCKKIHTLILLVQGSTAMIMLSNR